MTKTSFTPRDEPARSEFSTSIPLRLKNHAEVVNLQSLGTFRRCRSMDTKELLDLYHRLRERYERLSVEIDLLEVILVDMEKKLPDSATEDPELE